MSEAQICTTKTVKITVMFKLAQSFILFILNVEPGVTYLKLEPLHQSLSDELLLNSTQTAMSVTHTYIYR